MNTKVALIAVGLVCIIAHVEGSGQDVEDKFNAAAGGPGRKVGESQFEALYRSLVSPGNIRKSINNLEGLYGAINKGEPFDLTEFLAYCKTGKSVLAQDTNELYEK